MGKDEHLRDEFGQFSDGDPLDDVVVRLDVSAGEPVGAPVCLEDDDRLAGGAVPKVPV